MHSDAEITKGFTMGKRRNLSRGSEGIYHAKPENFAMGMHENNYLTI